MNEEQKGEEKEKMEPEKLPEESKPDEISEADTERFDFENLKKGFFYRFLVIDAILKERKSVFKNIMDEKYLGEYIYNALMVIIICSIIYGAVIGFFVGGVQIIYTALKLPICIISTFFICLPTFYIFNSLFGSKQSFVQTIALLLCLTTPTSILLVGFAPISWFFSISTATAKFMFFVHFIIFAICFIFGFSYLINCINTLQQLGAESVSKGNQEYKSNAGNSLFLCLWLIVYMIVQCQLLFYFRPFMVEGPFFIGEKGFFTEVF